MLLVTYFLLACVCVCIFSLQHLLINISHAVCCRLDEIDQQLESICQTTKYLKDQAEELRHAQTLNLENRSSQLARKRR